VALAPATLGARSTWRVVLLAECVGCSQGSAQHVLPDAGLAMNAIKHPPVAAAGSLVPRPSATGPCPTGSEEAASDMEALSSTELPRSRVDPFRWILSIGGPSRVTSLLRSVNAAVSRAQRYSGGLDGIAWAAACHGWWNVDGHHHLNGRRIVSRGGNLERIGA
jgi:hypothetical protein